MKYLMILIDNFRLKAMTPYRICELTISTIILVWAIWSIRSNFVRLDELKQEIKLIDAKWELIK